MRLFSFSVPKNYKQHENTINDPKKSSEIESTAFKVIESHYDHQAIAESIVTTLEEKYPSECFSIIVTQDATDISFKDFFNQQFLWFDYHESTWLIALIEKSNSKKETRVKTSLQDVYNLQVIDSKKRTK